MDDSLSYAADLTIRFVHSDALSQKGNPGRGKAGVPASDRDIGGNIDRPRLLRIAGSARDELISASSLLRESTCTRPHPMVITWDLRAIATLFLLQLFANGLQQHFFSTKAFAKSP